MVRWMRTARIKNGKFVDAITWAKEIAAFVEKKHKTPKVDVCVDAVGRMGTIRWIADYEDLSSFEKVQTKLMADAEYFQRVKEGTSKDLFIEGSFEDVMMRLV